MTVTHVGERDAASLVILSGGCGDRRGLIELTARRLKEKENREYRSLSPALRSSAAISFTACIERGSAAAPGNSREGNGFDWCGLFLWL